MRIRKLFRWPVVLGLGLVAIAIAFLCLRKPDQAEIFNISDESMRVYKYSDEDRLIIVDPVYYAEKDDKEYIRTEDGRIYIIKLGWKYMVVYLKNEENASEEIPFKEKSF